MVVSVDDRLVLDAARAGDVEAFAELVRRHQAAIYRVALRPLGSDADAQDAAQDTFVHAWWGLGRFRGESAVSTWLYRIVTNRCLNLLVAQRSTEVLDSDLVSTDNDPAHIAEQREHFATVARTVAEMPPEQRAALLRDFEGLSVRSGDRRAGRQRPGPSLPVGKRANRDGRDWRGHRRGGPCPDA